jgi:hypothetical protein
MSKWSSLRREVAPRSKQSDLMPQPDTRLFTPDEIRVQRLELAEDMLRLVLRDDGPTLGASLHGVGHMTVDTCGKPYLPTLHTAFKAHRRRAEVPRSSKESWCPTMAIRLA